MDSLTDILKTTRKRLLEYRVGNPEDEVSIHMNAFEIAVCLTEFSINTKPARPISKEEEQWFNVGFYIDSILVNSEWSDLIDLYYEILKEVRNKIFFR